MIRLNGSRGEFLLWFGLIYIALGLVYVISPGETVLHAMSWMPHWSTVRVCGIAWTLAGAAAIVFAFFPIPRDRFGFMALSAWSAAWAVAWVISQVTHHSDRGFVSALIFALLARVVMIVAGMFDAVKR